MLARAARRRQGRGAAAAGGGLDANTARYARTTFTVEMARVSPSFALSYGASLGLFGANVAGKGTPEQIERFALPVLRCEKIGAWGLTEPGAGSDALRGMKTTARRDGDHYVLNGSKTFITNAPYADVFLIYARVAGRRRSTARSSRSSSSAARPA